MQGFLIQGFSFFMATPRTQRLFDETLAWQAKRSVQKPPNQHSRDEEERLLGKRLADLLLRRFASIGPGPAKQKLHQADVELVNTIPGVPVRGCSTTLEASNLCDEHETEDQAEVRAPSSDVTEPANKRLRTHSDSKANLCDEHETEDHGAPHQAEVQAPSSDATEPANKRLRTHPDSKAVTLSLRGLNIQWPFSQLLLLGAKLEEVRTYDLGYRQICNRDEEAWIVETKGPPTKAATNAIVGDLQIAPRPSAAQIVGTVSFADSYPYGYIYLCFGTGFLGGPWASIDSQAYCRACHGVI